MLVGAQLATRSLDQYDRNSIRSGRGGRGRGRGRPEYHSMHREQNERQEHPPRPTLYQRNDSRPLERGNGGQGYRGHQQDSRYSPRGGSSYRGDYQRQGYQDQHGRPNQQPYQSYPQQMQHGQQSHSARPPYSNQQGYAAVLVRNGHPGQQAHPAGQYRPMPPQAHPASQYTTMPPQAHPASQYRPMPPQAPASSGSAPPHTSGYALGASRFFPNAVNAPNAASAPATTPRPPQNLAWSRNVKK
jgi:hypothetical protein